MEYSNILNEKKPGFIIYKDWANTLALLNMEQRGILLSNMYAVQTGGTMVEMDGVTEIFFTMIYQTFLRDQEKYDHISEVRKEASGKAKAKREQNREQKKRAEIPPPKNKDPFLSQEEMDRLFLSNAYY